MVIKESRLVTAVPDTPGGVQWRQCIAEKRTFDAMAALTTHILLSYVMPKSGRKSGATTSQRQFFLDTGPSIGFAQGGYLHVLAQDWRGPVDVLM